MKRISRTFRLPADLIERFDKAAETAGVDRTQVVESAIREFVEQIESGEKIIFRKETRKMRMWERQGYSVQEVSEGQFEVVMDTGEVVGTIITGGVEDREEIVSALNAGEDVNGWEDGAGNTIYINFNVMYNGGKSRYSDDAVDYMIVTIGDVELYAELPPGETETETYDALKDEIIRQAKENGINVNQLKFWYDE